MRYERNNPRRLPPVAPVKRCELKKSPTPYKHDHQSYFCDEHLDKEYQRCYKNWKRHADERRAAEEEAAGK